MTPESDSLPPIVITGTAEPGCRITLLLGCHVLAAVDVGDDGRYVFEATPETEEALRRNPGKGLTIVKAWSPRTSPHRSKPLRR